jgi:hypothetical protein
VERSAKPDLGSLQVHRRAAARAVRPGAGSRRDAQPLRRPAAARRPHGGDPAAADSTAVAVKPAADVDPETRARLAALGYVGTFVATPAADRSQLADPKDKIDLFNLVIEGRERSTTNPAQREDCRHCVRWSPGIRRWSTPGS